MSTEIELKLQLTPKVAKKLASHPLLANIAPQKQRLLNTYYDTAKLDLHARRIAVRFRQKGWQWLLTVKSAEPASGGLAMRSEWETAATPGIFDFSHVDNSELRTFLEHAQADLEPVFATDFKRQVWHVPYGESLIELAIDRAQVETPTTQRLKLNPDMKLRPFPRINWQTFNAVDPLKTSPELSAQQKHERGGCIQARRPTAPRSWGRHSRARLAFRYPLGPSTPP